MTLLQLAVAVLCLQANAQKVQKPLVINKPHHPAELAADIIEHVVATGAEPYLETRMPSLAWWQLALLDAKLILLTCHSHMSHPLIETAAFLALFCGLCIAIWAMSWVIVNAINKFLADSDEHNAGRNHAHGN